MVIKKKSVNFQSSGMGVLLIWRTGDTAFYWKLSFQKQFKFIILLQLKILF